jgi:hypothetical protein
MGDVSRMKVTGVSLFHRLYFFEQINLLIKKIVCGGHPCFSVFLTG